MLDFQSSILNRLCLMRHAHSGWPKPGERDFDRTLDDQGFAEAELVSQIAADRHDAPDLILCSTAMRCRQTGEALQRAFGVETEIRLIDELYNAPLESHLALISAQTAASIFLVGHNPAMETLLETFLGEDRSAATIPTGYPTAGLAILDRGGTISAAVGNWQLTDFIRP